MLRKAYTPARLLAEGVLLIAAGILLFFRPVSSLELALLLGRWVFLLSGLLALLDGLFHLREKKASLTKGLLMLLCAGALFFLPKTLAGSVSLIYGLWTAVNALFKLIYAVQLIINIFWSAWFFGLQAYLFAFIWLLLLITAIVIMIYVFYRADHAAALLQVSYLLWCVFAAYLNYGVWRLN